MNVLDNRKSNLRECTHAQNAANRNVKKDKVLGRYKGTKKVDSKWGAKINVKGSSIWLGRYNTEEEAAMAYNEAAIKYYGEFARLNVIAKAVLSLVPNCAVKE
jgi:hypothetical protein